MLVAVVVSNEEFSNKWAYSNGHIASPPQTLLIWSIEEICVIWAQVDI